MPTTRSDIAPADPPDRQGGLDDLGLVSGHRVDLQRVGADTVHSVRDRRRRPERDTHGTYTDNTNTGTGHALASFAGDDNHSGSSDTQNFQIEKAASATSVTCQPTLPTPAWRRHRVRPR